jgi:hypothetical protein
MLNDFYLYQGGKSSTVNLFISDFANKLMKTKKVEECKLFEI